MDAVQLPTGRPPSAPAAAPPPSAPPTPPGRARRRRPRAAAAAGATAAPAPPARPPARPASSCPTDSLPWSEVTGDPAGHVDHRRVDTDRAGVGAALGLALLAGRVGRQRPLVRRQRRLAPLPARPARPGGRRRAQLPPVPEARR